MGRYPWAEYFLFEVLYVIFFYPTRQWAYRAVVFTTMIYPALRVYLTQEVTNTVWPQYFVGFMVATHFMFMAYILFAEGSFPDRWRRVRDDLHAKVGSDNPPSDFPLMRKLQWTVDISWNTRMVGWVQKPRNSTPRHPHPPYLRREFLQKTFLKLIVNAAIADLATIITALSPPFDYRIHDPADGPEAYLAAIPLLHRVPYVLAWAIGTGASISTAHNAVALLCVGLGRSSPALWPDIWGSWGDAYTVRKFWGQTWHQQLRLMLAGLGRLVANKLLKFPRGTNLSSYTQLYVAFFLSAVLHFSGDFTYEKRITSRSFKFFLLQPVVIAFEDFVIHITKPLLRRGGTEPKPGKPRKPWAEVVLRIIGYGWVTLWLCLTLPPWRDELNVLGLDSADRRPIAEFLLNKWNKWV